MIPKGIFFFDIVPLYTYIIHKIIGQRHTARQKIT